MDTYYSRYGIPAVYSIFLIMLQKKSELLSRITFFL